LGVLDNVADRVPMGFVPRSGGDHDQLFLLGETHVELSGSEWAWVTHEHLGGIPPQVDLARERQLGNLLAAAGRVGHLSSAHDLSDGGLAQSLVESCLRRGVGARIVLPEHFAHGSMPFVFLFSESAGRVLVSVPRGHEKAFTALCAEHGVPWEFIGITDPAGGVLEVHDQFRIGLDELRTAHSETLPRLFGGGQAAQVAVEATRTGTTTVLPATAEQPVGVDVHAVAAEPIAATGDPADGQPAEATGSPGPETAEAERAVEAPAEAGDAVLDAADAPAETRDAPAETRDAAVEAGDAEVEAGDVRAEAGDAAVEAGDSPAEARDAQPEAGDAPVADENADADAPVAEAAPDGSVDAAEAAREPGKAGPDAAATASGDPDGPGAPDQR
jgi:phosphoribosylformylglycinamidine synthase subunit PurL